MLGFLAYKLFYVPNNWDKLTTLTYQEWVDLYDSASMFNKNRMATAAIVQAGHLANQYDAGPPFKKFMLTKNRFKILSQEVADEWISYIENGLRNDEGMANIDKEQVRTVFACAYGEIHDADLFFTKLQKQT